MRARVRRYTPVQAATIALVVSALIIGTATLGAWATQSRAAGSAPTAQWAAECSVLGCGRAVI